MRPIRSKKNTSGKLFRTTEFSRLVAKAERQFSLGARNLTTDTTNTKKIDRFATGMRYLERAKAHRSDLKSNIPTSVRQYLNNSAYSFYFNGLKKSGIEILPDSY
jgi:hypothetical protein